MIRHVPCVHSVTILIENFKYHLVESPSSSISPQISPNQISTREWIAEISRDLLPFHCDRFIPYLLQRVVSRIHRTSWAPRPWQTIAVATLDTFFARWTFTLLFRTQKARVQHPYVYSTISDPQEKLDQTMSRFLTILPFKIHKQIMVHQSLATSFTTPCLLMCSVTTRVIFPLFSSFSSLKLFRAPLLWCALSTRLQSVRFFIRTIATAAPLHSYPAFRNRWDPPHIGPTGRSASRGGGSAAGCHREFHLHGPSAFRLRRKCSQCSIRLKNHRKNMCRIFFSGRVDFLKRTIWITHHTVNNVQQMETANAAYASRFAVSTALGFEEMPRCCSLVI